MKTKTTNQNGHASDIECGQCGARFYYELLECPECGASVYGEEVEDEVASSQGSHLARSEGEGHLPEIGPLVLGIFTSGLVLVGLYFPLLSGFSFQANSAGARLLLILTAAFSAVVGGWVAGRFASRGWRGLGLLTGAGTLGLAVLLYELAYGQAAALLANSASWTAVPLILMAGWGGASIAERMLRSQAAESLFGPVIQENVLYQRLLAISGYDKNTVERLIEYEGRRKPHASRVELMQRAIERWERDSR